MKLLELPERIRVVEVGMRDGLQAVTTPIPTQKKIEIIEGLIESGVREIEAVSFAHPKVLPQLADAEEVMKAVPRRDDVVYRGLVPNLRGAERAIDCGLDEIVVVVPVDDGVAIKNQGRPTAELLKDLPSIKAVADRAGSRLLVAVACAFFAPARGPVTVEERNLVIDSAVDAGAEGVYLATTSGQEHPRELADGLVATRERHPFLDIGVHLHNRNGFASANAMIAMAAGADWIETSFAGLGGDLWFPGDPSVLGNAATEDLVHLCQGLGIETGINLELYREIVAKVVEATGIPSYSFVSRGGTRQDLATAEWPE